MDIDHLNKSQLVLLTLFVSFVTSIATGVVTVSLMQQAPPAITQTVSKVIERTVEKLVPGQTASAASVPTKTIVVTQTVNNDTNTVAQAVDHAANSVVRIATVPSADNTESVFLGLGVVLDAHGTVATDAEVLGERADAQVTLSAGTPVRMFVVGRDDRGIAYLSAASSTDPAIHFTPISISGQRSTLGSSIIVLGGKMSTRVAVGIVTAINRLSQASSSPQIIDTDVAQASILPGAPLLDSSGSLLGISTAGSRSVAQQSFISSLIIAIPEKLK